MARIGSVCRLESRFTSVMIGITLTQDLLFCGGTDHSLSAGELQIAAILKVKCIRIEAEIEVGINESQRKITKKYIGKRYKKQR